jgi:Spy/CpxP family protein refolding chaperone
VLSEGRTRIEQVLTPEQRSKFERLLAEQNR